MATTKPTKFHINSKGDPAPCSATVYECKYADDNPDATHFPNVELAEKHVQEVLERRYGILSLAKKSHKVKLDKDTVLRNGKRMSVKEANLYDNITKLAKEYVNERAKIGDEIVLEKTNISIARKRLDEAIDFADLRNNTHLVKLLSESKVMPTGIFSIGGRKFYTKDFVSNKKSMDKVEFERDRIVSAMNAIVASGGITQDSYKMSDNNGSYSVKISNKLNEDEYNKLPENVRHSISSVKNKIDLDLVRENISEEKMRQFTSMSLVTQTIAGSTQKFDKGMNVNTRVDEMSGSGDEKMNQMLAKTASLYGATRQAYDGKTYKKMKADNAEINEVIKAKASVYGGNVVIPAGARADGVLVHSRIIVHDSIASQILSKSELAKVTVKKYSADIDKAREVLSPEDFAKIFPRTAQLTVREKD